MKQRPNEITAPIDDTFDETKTAESFKEFAVGFKPKRAVLFNVLENSQNEIRHLVQVGAGPAEIAKGFTQRGFPVSAAKMKLFIDLRIKRKRTSRRKEKLRSSEGTGTVPTQPENADRSALPPADAPKAKVTRM